MYDGLWRWLMKVGHPDPTEVRITDVDKFDERISEVERKQGEIAARLQLLERQADPRGSRLDG